MMWKNIDKIIQAVAGSEDSASWPERKRYKKCQICMLKN